MTLLQNKLAWHNTSLNFIDTAKIKASHYNHRTNEYKKKELSERWNMIDEEKVQRDMYSAFLIMNVDDDLKSINREKCLDRYGKFKQLHDVEIERIKTSAAKRIVSMGI
ncbi:hypothetical protein AGMMS49975_21410 [Clostridia bacterium]|nr:hypothetical protein AGMMS49975_21410 [Clostridia bacterium]